VKLPFALGTLGGICVALSACGGTPPTPAPIPTATIPNPIAAPAAPAPVAATRAEQTTPPGQANQPGSPLVPAVPTLAGAEVPKYDDRGRKDPFTEVSLSATTGGLAVSTTRLTGIVRGRRSTLALLETQEGIGYILKPGDTLGDGRLMEIGADNVVFTVAPKAGTIAQRVVLRLAAN
jgi:hypothetical protein